MQTEPNQRKWNRQLRAVQLIALFLMTQATAVFGLNFDATLASLTNHNTSAYSNYNENTYGANFGTSSWINQNGTTMAIDPTKMDESLNPITPGHVSHTDVHTLIPSRPDLRWFANGTCWFGESSHINIGVNNNTTAYAAAMVNDMESRGFNGMIFSWYGKGDQSDDVALKVQSYLASSSNTNKNFHFIIMVVFGDFHGGESVTNLEANITYCKNQYFSDPNYEHEPVTNGNPILMFFNVRSSTYMSEADMETIKAATDPDAIWVDEHDGHITEPWVGMTYQWTDCFTSGINTSDPFNLNVITNEYPTIKANPTKQAFGAMCAHFNGTLTKSVGWSEGKYLPGSNGLCEVERAAEINSVIPTNMTRMQWATWSDWEEGTEVESGTENNFALNTRMNSSNLLSWTITSGDERTIDHYDIYAATNGGNAALLCSVPAGIHQTNIVQLGLAPGSYQLYVNSIGKPCIRDHMSSPLSYLISESPMVLSDLQPSVQTVWQSDPVSFTVTAGGVAPLSYQWTLNGQAIAGATNSMYTFSALTGTNFYEVAITNSLGSVNSSTGEVVGMAGTFLTAPNNYYGMRITFGGYTNGGGLPDFPVLVRLSTNLPGFSYAQFVSPGNGADLRFTSDTGRELYFQIDQWNPAGESLVWVQVPSITTSNDYITANWGNPADSAMQPCNTNGATWTTLSGADGFLRVYHLSEGGFPYADATLQYPAISGVAPGSTNGMVGSGCSFTRTPYLDIGSVNLGNSFTLSSWANVSSGVSDIQCIYANGPGSSGSAEIFFYVNSYKTSDGTLLLSSGDGSNGTRLASAAGVVGLDQWHLLTATVDRANGAATLYVDGAQVASGAVGSDFPTNNDMELARDTGGSFAFLGSLDEARIHSGLESSNWVWASYMTVAANSSFENYSAVIAPVITLYIQTSGSNVILTWPAGTLQSANQITGPYRDLSGANSPYTNTVSGPQEFFRVQIGE
ncbi:MAG TPA: DUF2341 domain-containing protein [Verrucomicrobiae bacterium]